ncbi:AzlD domain-containing protein [Neoroseomonas rubea]|uniref:AzlD domain-containing protein n=1 Tax=Neoroseomonas rubea TaxID=2748666 RepID=UPI0018DEFDBF
MPPADLALLLTALACLGLRLAGVWLAGGLSVDHPAIAWATAVAQATLAAFVTLAILLPPGALAEVPLFARLAGLGVGVTICLAFRRRLLPSLLAGLAAMLVVRALLQGG